MTPKLRLLCQMFHILGLFARAVSEGNNRDFVARAYELRELCTRAIVIGTPKPVILEDVEVEDDEL